MKGYCCFLPPDTTSGQSGGKKLKSGRGVLKLKFYFQSIYISKKNSVRLWCKDTIKKRYYPKWGLDAPLKTLLTSISAKHTAGNSLI